MYVHQQLIYAPSQAEDSKRLKFFIHLDRYIQEVGRVCHVPLFEDVPVGNKWSTYGLSDHVTTGCSQDLLT